MSDMHEFRSKMGACFRICQYTVENSLVTDMSDMHDFRSKNGRMLVDMAVYGYVYSSVVFSRQLESYYLNNTAIE